LIKYYTGQASDSESFNLQINAALYLRFLHASEILEQTDLDERRI
jgi:hypothetical protein